MQKVSVACCEPPSIRDPFPTMRLLSWTHPSGICCHWGGSVCPPHLPCWGGGIGGRDACMIDRSGQRWHQLESSQATDQIQEEGWLSMPPLPCPQLPLALDLTTNLSDNTTVDLGRPLCRRPRIAPWPMGDRNGRQRQQWVAAGDDIDGGQQCRNGYLLALSLSYFTTVEDWALETA